jgi:hypothetical protein
MMGGDRGRIYDIEDHTDMIRSQFDSLTGFEDV